MNHHQPRLLSCTCGPPMREGMERAKRAPLTKYFHLGVSMLPAYEDGKTRINPGLFSINRDEIASPEMVSVVSKVSGPTNYP